MTGMATVFLMLVIGIVAYFVGFLFGSRHGDDDEIGW